jgi:hypothetical protein
MHARLFGNQHALAEEDLLRSADAIALDRQRTELCGQVQEPYLDFIESRSESVDLTK